MSDQEETKPTPPEFDFEAFPPDTLFFDRRDGQERRYRQRLADEAATAPTPAPTEVAPSPSPAPERRAKKERRRRIDPTTFEKQYTDDELEFMNAMQKFKVQSGKSFPSHREVIKVVVSLGYRRPVDLEDGETDGLGLNGDAVTTMAKVFETGE